MKVLLFLRSGFPQPYKGQDRTSPVLRPVDCRSLAGSELAVSPRDALCLVMMQ